jgi:hypothetical protein
MGTLHRFWLTFKHPPQFSPLGLGCGVTAYNYADALELVRSRVFSEKSMPVIESVTQDVDIQTLDKYHVVPNMGLVNNRAVWYPLGY